MELKKNRDSCALFVYNLHDFSSDSHHDKAHREKSSCAIVRGSEKIHCDFASRKFMDYFFSVDRTFSINANENYILQAEQL